LSSRETIALAKAACASSESAVIAGSLITRQIEVFERSASFLARNAAQSDFATQSASTLALASARACMPFKPPTVLPHSIASTASSMHSIDTVLMVAPSKMSAMSLPPLVMRKILGSGQAGL